ncbi:hypothetical protein IKD57_03445 [Candidatus Saccharibacteria bacterium]|nr:hypothetical protein [Candidatus Saccharibacteria bacterium]
MDYGHTNSPKRTDDIFDVAITPGVGEKDEAINPEIDNSLNSEVSNSDNRKIGSEALRFNEEEKLTPKNTPAFNIETQEGPIRSQNISGGEHHGYINQNDFTREKDRISSKTLRLVENEVNDFLHGKKDAKTPAELVDYNWESTKAYLKTYGRNLEDAA